MYQLKLEKRAEAEFKKLSSEILKRVDSKLSVLENDPRPKGVKEDIPNLKIKMLKIREELEPTEC